MKESATNLFTIRNSLLLFYLLGNAMTYRHLVKTDPGHALESWSMLKNLGISCVWPIYWAVAALT
jgi:hypothetical protein